MRVTSIEASSPGDITHSALWTCDRTGVSLFHHSSSQSLYISLCPSLSLCISLHPSLCLSPFFSPSFSMCPPLFSPGMLLQCSHCFQGLNSAFLPACCWLKTSQGLSSELRDSAAHYTGEMQAGLLSIVEMDDSTMKEKVWYGADRYLLLIYANVT